MWKIKLVLIVYHGYKLQLWSWYCKGCDRHCGKKLLVHLLLKKCFSLFNIYFLKDVWDIHNNESFRSFIYFFKYKVDKEFEGSMVASV